VKRWQSSLLQPRISAAGGPALMLGANNHASGWSKIGASRLKRGLVTKRRKEKDSC